MIQSWLQAQATNAQMEKRQRQFDKALDEWKKRVAEQQTETERWQKEARNHAAECYRIKAQVDEAQQTIEALRKDNKNLNGIVHRCNKRSDKHLKNVKNAKKRGNK